MPQIIVTAGDGSRDERSVTLRERVSASDFESERFTVNLLERLGWAVGDATEVEREQPATSRDERSEPRRRTGRITGERRRRDPDHEPDLEPVGSA